MNSLLAVYEKLNRKNCFYVSAFVKDEVPYMAFGTDDAHFDVRVAYELEDMELYTDACFTNAKRMATKLLNTVQMEWVVDYLVTNNATFIANDNLEFFAISHNGEAFHDDPASVFNDLKINKQKKLDAKQIQLVAVGLPGCGKTTLMQSLADCYSGVYHDQDQAGARYHTEAAQLSKDKKIPMIAFGKNHHTRKIRAALTGAIDIGQLVYLTWYHPSNSVIELAKTCVVRAKARVNHALKPGKAAMVIGGFRNKYEPLTDDEIKSTVVIKVNILQDTRTQLQSVCEQLDRLC